VLREGRFGPYVTDGETNASLRKGDTVETITPQRAIELLAERRAAAPAPRRKPGTRSAGSRTTKTAKKAGTATASAAKSAAKTPRGAKKAAAGDGQDG
jgi:DNA topoisomerase I